jgi:hypothetical protein
MSEALSMRYRNSVEPKNMRSVRHSKQRLLTATRVSLLLALTVSIDSAAESPAMGARYTNPRYAFELTIPAELEPFTPPESPAALVLRSKDGGYPTFNVIVSAPSGHQDALSLDQQGARVIEDYRKIGLLDARLLSLLEERISERKASVFTLEYSASGERFKALVALLAGRRFQYLLTYIDRSTQFEERLGIARSIVDSFHSSDPAAEVSSDEAASSAWPYFLLAGVLLGLTFFSALAFRSRRRTMPN